MMYVMLFCIKELLMQINEKFYLEKNLIVNKKQTENALNNIFLKIKELFDVN